MKAIVSGLALAVVLATAGSAASAGENVYVRTNLVSDVPNLARTFDANLVNPWGVAFLPGGAFWISDNGTGLSTLYDGTGNRIPAVFTVPGPRGASGHSAPTGIIVNPTRGFLVPGTSLPALFIFATEDGTISAWAPGEQYYPQEAVLAVDNSKNGAVYKGLEFGVTAAGTFLYATNFHAGTIDVFDSAFVDGRAKLLGTFRDPGVPAGYAPFGIRNIDGNLFVTYAKQNDEKHDDVAGPGNGLVDIFDTDGHLLRRFQTGGQLNSPWGIARAPDGFGELSDTILIGNFGDGLINAYRPNGSFRDALRGRNGSPVRVRGLWGLYFGGATASTPRTLFFTAGIAGEAHGLFGSIAPRAE